MEYKDYPDFIRRTQIIVNQYHDGNFDVTLLINCVIGLLFIAKEKFGSVFPQLSDSTSFDNWGLKKEDIKYCKHYSSKGKSVVDEKITIKSVIKHIRKSFAHCNFTTVSKDSIITGILLKDYYVPHQDFNKATLTFEMLISIERLKCFLLEVSSYVLQQKNKKIR